MRDDCDAKFPARGPVPGTGDDRAVPFNKKLFVEAETSDRHRKSRDLGFTMRAETESSDANLPPASSQSERRLLSRQPLTRRCKNLSRLQKGR